MPLFSERLLFTPTCEHCDRYDDSQDCGVSSMPYSENRRSMNIAWSTVLKAALSSSIALNVTTSIEATKDVVSHFRQSGLRAVVSVVSILFFVEAA